MTRLLLPHASSPSLVAALLLATAAPALAAGEPGGIGGLLVAPTRVVLEGRVRTAEIGLVNSGNEPGTYRVSLVPMRMSEEGRITTVEGPLQGTEAVASELIRFSPRQVTLGPGEIQTVRLQVRKPAELPSGEYRIHMTIRKVPDVDDGGAVTAGAGMSVQLVPVYGVSVPVIVRHGDTAAEVGLSDLRVVPGEGDGAPHLSFTIDRSGNRSVHGDLKATAISPDGQERVVGIQKGIAVYTPIARRRVQLPLSVAPERLAGAASIRLTYTDADGALLADAVASAR